MATQRATHAMLRRLTISTRALLAMLAALIMAPGVLAQGTEMSATAQIEDDPVVIGAPFTFTIAIKGTDDVERPDLSSLSVRYGVRDLGRSQSSSLQMVGSQMVSSTTVEFHYQMTVRSAGAYVIPPIDVRAGGRTLRTNEVRFSAAAAPETDEFQVQIQVDNTTPYVGEPITITLTIYTASSSMALPDISQSGDFDLFDATSDPNWNGDRQQPFEFLGGDVQPIIGRGTYNGRVYTSIKVARRLIPRRAGHATLGPITVSTQFVRVVRQGLFESTQPGKRVAARSGSIEVDVRPLPTEGRPAVFNGLIGRYEVHADADPKDVSVGDPITLHVLVTGEPLADDVRLPDLESMPGFSGRFRLSGDRPEQTETQGGTLFTVHARALNDSVDAIPPIELAFFDPQSGRYGVAKSDAIPLKVRPTKRVTALDAVGSAPISTGTTVETVTAGIAHNYDGPDALRVVPTSVLAEVRAPVWVAATAAPPLAYAVCLAGVAMKRRGEKSGTARRRSRALGEATSILREAQSVDGVVAGVGTYFEMVTGRPRASITPQDAEALVAHAAPEEATRLRGILDRCDAARFAGASVEDVRTLRADAQALLKAIDPRLKRGRKGGEA